jgi:ketosteroid isomerase-like protein
MSEAVEDLVRLGYEGFNAERTVASGFWVTSRFWHEDGEYVNARDDPEPAIHRGLDAINRIFLTWFEAYPDLRVEPLEIRSIGNRAFVWVRFSGHGAGSGVPIEMERAHIWTVEDGKIRRIEEYMDRDEALEAAGLRE